MGTCEQKVERLYCENCGSYNTKHCKECDGEDCGYIDQYYYYQREED
ncbi:hypothetical protein AGMMS49592_0540 [Endomicrobiia bacterium]|nr:hypothetical protein AGMMS49592_0540 [Endomicrobiia bacterium]